MAMRLNGLMSGIDTESIIQQLVEARKTKVTTAKKAQMKVDYKINAWKSLNTKLKNLQSKYISNMRFSDAYTKKTTKVSNSDVVSVLTGDSAVLGAQSLKVTQTAKTGILTGGQLSNNGSVTALTKMSDLVGDDFEGGNINITSKDGSKSANIQLTAESTISDVLTQMRNAGFNASFDEKQQRIFISSKESGEANDFEITAGDDGGAAVLSALKLTEASGATKVKGQDAIIELNGAEFRSSNNVFEINGLTFTALRETVGDETVTVTTERDTSGIYDMIKNFLKEYNSIINEIDKLYNAEAAKGYEPLTSEEKESLSETEIKEWEDKIKDSILRRDSNLNTVGSTLKEVMASGFEINGKTYHLFDFGIETLGYFNSADNEKNAYHINGDPDDDSTSGNMDKLMGMITNDPDTVVSFFTQLSQSLYGKMSDLSKSVDGYRSFGNFYDDKKMKEDYDSYTTKIAELEEKLNKYEDSWYAKFAKMESAMAKMQQNTSAITSLLGGS